MKERKTAPGYVTCYLVGHTELPTVPVLADSWEQATVEAAKLWGVPWPKVACGCYLEQKIEQIKGVCMRCKRPMYNRPQENMCEACKKKTETENAEAAARMQWHLMKKKT